ncbi:hypothetical protein KFE96_13910 [Kordiimonas sp. SCSIO 12603]|uniref:glyoxalase superfamily protein n=1 Tax=Kordiimonas sp. SCSIO 12603 TaxID=2829596 RepID=UPI0021064DDF|nr:glyoxalase superfamily protein [Kordiimonas sp. SCSIO 12603]UTW57911.1 hypothetical protein KFE96_13910 [Kordiimonas sp. SCSIO 12603]
MNGLNVFPTIAELKARAKELRSATSAAGTSLSHSESLEAVAHKHGFRDWNTLRAKALANNTLRIEEGGLVSGYYLGQCFKAEVLAFNEWSQGRYKVKLDLVEPVDVVAFDSFSAFRKRINAEIGANGKSFAHTSDGRAHLELTL